MFLIGKASQSGTTKLLAWCLPIAGAGIVLFPLDPVWATLPRTTIPTHYDVMLRPDIAGLRFSADENIEISVRSAEDEIVLNAADLDIERVRLRTEQGASLGRVRVRLDQRDQTVHLSLGSTIQPGRYVLAIAYSGTIQRNSSGLFALDQQGKRYLFTQFEAADARRLIPSWDEPSFKATFTLKTLVPSGSMAISNMPVARDELVRDGRHQVRFAPTPKMSTYLLFLAIGDFERTTRKVDGVELGVVARRGVASQTGFALDSASQVLPWLNSYFGYRFPLRKLDNVAGPGASLTYGAMENWGAIFSFEKDFLIDPKVASEHQKQGVFTTAAHEMAHQWFGDLVTMRWWDDLWLNEGFASWMEQKAGEHFHPEWSADLAFMSGRDLAMEADALDTSHPVVQPVPDAAGALQAFDFITYFKGEATIRMLEAYVGPAAWRAGIRDYIARHAYGSATSADLWGSVGAAARQPVDAIARDMTRQAGLPLVEASEVCENGRTVIRLEERRFHSDGRDDPGPGWHLPMLIGHPGETPRSSLLYGKGKASIPGCGATIVNVGQKSYFRTSYSPSMLSSLSRAFPTLDQVDQLALLSDTAALGFAGTEAPEDVLELTAHLGPDAPVAVVGSALSRWNDLYGHAGSDAEGKGRLRAFAEMAFAPRLQRLGWVSRAGEPAGDANLRDQLIEVLGGAGVPAVLDEARRIFGSADASPPSAAILSAVSRNATPAEWNRLKAMAQGEQSPQFRSKLYQMLGRAADSELAARALDLSITDDPGGTIGPEMIEVVAISHPLMAFRFALAHSQTILQGLDSFSAPTYLAELPDHGDDGEILIALQTYCGKAPSKGVSDACATTTSIIKDRIRIRRERMPRIYAWLNAEQPTFAPSP